MKAFKTIDCWISFILIAFFVPYGILVQGSSFFYGYFIVGGWQIVSMFVHAVNQWFTGDDGWRKRYHKIVLGLIVVAVVSGTLGQIAELFFFPLWFLLVVLLFVAPLMAIYYACMCYRETYYWMKRPLDLLK